MFGLRTREDKKSCTLVFKMEILFGRKKKVHGRDAFGSNVFKNPARYIT